MRTVEVFADVLCPFTCVGLHTLIDRRTERGLTEPRLRIRAWPLELKPPAAEETSAAVRADWDEGRARGVIGSPHFFTADGAGWFCPGLDISRDDVGNFVIAWKQGTESFVDSVFS